MNTTETRQLMAELGVVPMKADMTRDNPDAQRILKELGRESNALPYYAIFPAGDPNRPIVFDGPVTEGYVQEKLKQAGPSKPDVMTALRP